MTREYRDAMPKLADIHEEYDFLEPDDRYRLLIDLGRDLEPMPDALKTDATLVRGCSASVWVYPMKTDDGRLHFLADSNAAITKGIIALVLQAVQDQPPAAIVAIAVPAGSWSRCEATPRCAASASACAARSPVATGSATGP